MSWYVTGVPSALGAVFNKLPTRSNFEGLALQSPPEAKAVIARLIQGLVRSGASPEHRQSLETLFNVQDAQLAGLTAGSPALKALFPDAPAAASFA